MTDQTSEQMVERKPLSAEEVLMGMIARTANDLKLANHHLNQAEAEVISRSEEVARLNTIKEGLDTTLTAIRTVSPSATPEIT